MVELTEDGVGFVCGVLLGLLGACVGGLKKRLYLKLAGRKLLEGAAYVHCTADDELAQSGKWFPRGRGRVVPNLIDLEPYGSLPGPEEARQAFLHRRPCVHVRGKGRRCVAPRRIHLEVFTARSTTRWRVSRHGALRVAFVGWPQAER